MFVLRVEPAGGDHRITGRTSPLPKTGVFSLTARLFVGMMLSPNEQHPGFGRCAARLPGGLLRLRLYVSRLHQISSTVARQDRRAITSRAATVTSRARLGTMSIQAAAFRALAQSRSSW